MGKVKDINSENNFFVEKVKIADEQQQRIKHYNINIV